MRLRRLEVENFRGTKALNWASSTLVVEYQMFLTSIELFRAKLQELDLQLGVDSSEANNPICRRPG